MSLEDILGKTPQILIFDFLAANRANTYSAAEILEGLNYSINAYELYNGMKSLVENGLLDIEIKHICKCPIEHYTLKKNQITSCLIGAVFANGIYISEKAT